MSTLTDAPDLALHASPVRKFWFDEVPPPATPSAERRHRLESLAGAFRLFARYGFDQGLAGHITARDPEWHDHFWVNPLGRHFARMRVSDLLLVNSAGGQFPQAAIEQAGKAIEDRGGDPLLKGK